MALRERGMEVAGGKEEEAKGVAGSEEAVGVGGGGWEGGDGEMVALVCVFFVRRKLQSPR